ncbi:hypothetical protein [Prevotella sp. oral taxon 299]|uniref:hypothetical protein n=1 Tax=Prevotella sp. oral taxon 299 TaxID=652716 RepID=UPI0001C3F809|nr:hypothetical protein [Prevotella sp. oral taxon 299]EFC71528.1 hypothetical protein HMPREF0669_00200 [Prevotella sp. oral taxon 299 str. F0039]
MEIKLNAGDRIIVPENCTATIEDKLIIIEEEQEEFKEGDILISKYSTSILIFSNYRKDGFGLFDSYFNNTNKSNSAWVVKNFRHATEEEKQTLYDSLKEQGLYWNAGKKEMERIRKRAEKGEKYLFITGRGEIVEYTEDNDYDDDEAYDLGNYFLLSERKEAEEYAKALKAIFEKRLKVIQD